MFEEYYWYAFVILLMALSSLLFEVYDKRKNLINVQKLAKSLTQVLKKETNTNSFIQVSSEELVPGDIIQVKSDSLMPCDAILLSGIAIMNESMLTGESTVVSKVALHSSVEIFEGDNSKKFTLFSGTKVVQVNNSCIATALVIRTGYQTTKGALVRSILYPRQTKFNFYVDSMKYVGVMVGLAILGFCVTIKTLVSLSLSGGDVAMKCLDLITIAVPPALPTFIQIGISFALVRLKKSKIYCIAPQKVNAVGRISTVIFDKTGTLTDNGQSLFNVYSCISNENTTEIKAYYNKVENLIKDNNNLSKEVLICMACCHSLLKMENQFSDDIILVGDPLEVELFKYTKYMYTVGNELEKASAFVVCDPSLKEKYECIKVIDFVSIDKRMSTIIKHDNGLTLYCKGAPEVIKSLSIPTSIPSEFNNILSANTEKGYRVLALSYKKLDSAVNLNQDRTAFENELTFLGFLIFENKLKDATIKSLKELKDANIHSVMATGDNIDTAICVGKNCMMIDPTETVIKCEVFDNKLSFKAIQTSGGPAILCSENEMKSKLSADNSCLAITGDAYARIRFNKDLMHFIVSKGKIFARMAPEGKASLIQEWQKNTKLMIAMCGDGANDCDALKTADVGLSLSDAEASIAAPFTSKVLDISSVPTLLKEGRAALATSIQCFKYMALYSMIQFTTTTVLYYLYTFLSNMQFLFEDLFIVICLATTMSW
jgi:cation-transporting ATPase 13A3/4/5